MRILVHCSLLTALAALSLSGCGGGSSSDAATAMTAAMGAAGQAQSRVLSDLGSLRADGMGIVTGSEASFTINGTVNNPTGAGSSTVSGSGSKSGNTYTFTMNVTFNGWVEAATGLTLSGSLSLSYTATSLNPPAMTVRYSGDVRVSGRVNGSFSFNVTICYAGQGSFSYRGTVGGFSVNYGTGSC